VKTKVKGLLFLEHCHFIGKTAQPVIKVFPVDGVLIRRKWSTVWAETDNARPITPIGETVDLGILWETYRRELSVILESF
jgi:hypothetical protein